MRKQIAAANWKMNLTLPQAENLMSDVMNAGIELEENQEVIFAVPFPYLTIVNGLLARADRFFSAAQNCHNQASGAFTGETSAEMLHSIDVEYCLVGHSERRQYYQETDLLVSQKINMCLQHDISPIFCCGEPLSVRESDSQNEYVASQLRDSLLNLEADQLTKVIIAYEPIWAIGTGKTATTAQAQEMHSYLRSLLAAQFGNNTAGLISILYGGSIKASNAKELFAAQDVDGGLIGGASLLAADFIQIIGTLKK